MTDLLLIRITCPSRRVAELRPYDVPAIVALPCAQASVPYAAWVNENTDS